MATYTEMQRNCAPPPKKKPQKNNKTNKMSRFFTEKNLGSNCNILDTPFSRIIING